MQNQNTKLKIKKSILQKKQRHINKEVQLITQESGKKEYNENITKKAQTPMGLLQIRKIDEKKKYHQTASCLSHYNILFGQKLAPQQKQIQRTESNQKSFYNK